MPCLDFVPVGLTARWPSKRWLEFLEGPSAGPFWGAHLGHADASAALYVCAYPRARYDAVMQRPGEDPLREVAFSVTHVLISRALVQAHVDGAQRGTLSRRLVQYAQRQAAAYQSWRSIRWQLDAALAAGQEVPAQAISLAGWEAAFAVTADCYVVAYSYGAPLEGIVLSPVQDPRPYGFTLEDAVQPAVAPDVAGNEASEELHADLASILAD